MCVRAGVHRRPLSHSPFFPAPRATTRLGCPAGVPALQGSIGRRSRTGKKKRNVFASPAWLLRWDPAAFGPDLTPRAPVQLRQVPKLAPPSPRTVAATRSQPGHAPPQTAPRTVRLSAAPFPRVARDAGQLGETGATSVSPSRRPLRSSDPPSYPGFFFRQ